MPNAKWYGSGERKVLTVKMKNWKEKSEVIKNRRNPRGTNMYLDDDTTREEEHTEKIASTEEMVEK